MTEEVSTSVDDAWFMSAKQGRDDDLGELVKIVKNVNMQDSSGNTALHYSAANHVECVKILLAAKADVNAKNRLEETPLHKVIYAHI
jgi:ankyrin repeat protein